MKLSYNEYKPVAIPTTKFETKALVHFKYDIMDEYGRVDFSRLPYNDVYDEAIHFLKHWLKLPMLQGNEPDEVDGILFHHDEFWYRKGGQEYSIPTPSNLEVIATVYKMTGKYRKLAMLRKKYANKWWSEELD